MNTSEERVIVILTDGMSPDAIKHVEKAQRFFDGSASTLNGKTVMPSDTLPCHMSLFKGCEPEKHECTSNYDPKYYNKIKGLCEVLQRRDKKSAMFYSWGELRDLTKPGVPAFDCYISGYTEGAEQTIELISEAALSYLSRRRPEFTFIHYDLIDEYGHWHGWMSDKYLEAVKLVWDEIYKILDIADEDTTVIILSDHSGHDTDHGSEEDTTIPIMIKSKHFKSGSSLDGATIMDIAPTITKILGVDADPEWTGKCLLN